MLYGPFRRRRRRHDRGVAIARATSRTGATLREALREIELDAAEGADLVMVKPALAYLDVIAAARPRVDVPIAAYHVSGEYAMVRRRRRRLDRRRAVALEHLTAIKRAGADVILTYLKTVVRRGPGRA